MVSSPKTSLLLVKVLKQFGTFAPAFGMIGTLIGLVIMLANLSDPSLIGPSMAVAIITTFYGALSANLVALPMAEKLNIRNKEETLIKEMMIKADYAADDIERVVRAGRAGQHLDSLDAGRAATAQAAKK